jgi:hypothetical protein
MNKNLRLAVMLAVCLLAGCGVARERARLTYDPAKIVPNAERTTIEAEIGAPDHARTRDDGLTEATYISARVSADTKRSLIANREVADLFLVGGAELIDPFAISDDESKVFLIVYGSDQRAKTVYVKCQKAQPATFEPVPPQGFSPVCSALIKG